MGSGLDDYPRSNPEQISKYHIDIQCWMTFFLESFIELAELLDIQSDVIKLRIYLENSRDNLKVYYDKSDGIYKDVFQKIGNQNTKIFSNHIGYPNLFPYFFGYGSSDSLLEMLKLVNNKEELFSVGGIRSLSLKDQFYGTGDNYWRGSVWININYMFLRGVNKYYKQ